ncbi:malonate decarboxylase subunit epsilon [Telmatospirillum siberiense]|uniref:Malonyl CoA-acyl carrier protein transacylase n=1 Tax=Telmatospirillum siberiense TaxID=382514 RepID=A0A2N3PZ96_9PROT|nr:malonate decarboxylase subunit epsilon [Telmatospirillum siberiense]PKU25730.1 malonate decarboxylase subunit epsilon [Telmatospirillum siberiense]
MSIAFLFPGQGAQTPGFLHRLPDHPVVAATLAEAGEILGQDVLALDDAGALASTVAVQIATVTAGVALARLAGASGVRPDGVAGLSVGAFSAAIAGGSLTFADGLPLVRLRAQLMEQAYPTGYGLAAVVGLDERRLAGLIEENFDQAAPVYLANLNAPTQFVIAGAEDGLEAILGLARAAGARKAERMAVGVPSHCPLLEKVARVLAKAIAEIPMAIPECVYVDNRRARATRDPELIRADLAGNVMYPVRWHDGSVLLYELGARLFIEMPPGHVLTNLAAAVFDDARAIAAEETPLETITILADRERRLDEER